MKYTNEFDEDLMGLTIETNDPWLDRKLNSHICYKKALKKVEKPFRSGKTAAKKAASKSQAREQEIFDINRQAYFDEKARLNPALKHAQARFQDSGRQAERDQFGRQEQQLAQGAINQFGQLAGDVAGQREAGLEGLDRLRGLSPQEALTSGQFEQAGNIGAFQKLAGADPLAAGQRFSDARAAAQEQGYADLAERLGTSNRDEAIASSGRLGALSGQRARRQGQLDRSAREAAGALAAQNFDYGQQAGGQELSRQAGLAGQIGQIGTGALTGADASRQRAFGQEQELASQLQGIGSQSGAQLGQALQGTQAAATQASAAEYRPDVAYINAVRGLTPTANYDTSGLDRADARVAAGARGPLAGTFERAVGKGFQSIGLNEGGGVYANAGYLAAAAQFLPQVLGALGGAEAAIDPAMLAELMQKTGWDEGKATEYLTKQQKDKASQQAGDSFAADQEATRRALLGYNKGGYAKVMHSSTRRS